MVLLILSHRNFLLPISSLEKVTSGLGIKTGQILQALRMTLTGGASGPDLMMIMEIIGVEETVSRLKYALENLKVANP